MEFETIFFAQGTDIDCKNTYLQKNGSPLNMAIPGTKVYLVLYNGYGNIQAKYKNGGAASGWIVLDSTLAASGILQFKIQSEVTKLLEPGKYELELLARFASGQHADGYYDVKRKHYAFTITRSVTNTLSSLP